MGQVTTLLDAVREIETLDENKTIYAREPWTPSSAVLVIEEPESGGLPGEAVELGFVYFIEVFEARSILASWETARPSLPNDLDKCGRLIQYALRDA